MRVDGCVGSVTSSHTRDKVKIPGFVSLRAVIYDSRRFPKPLARWLYGNLIELSVRAISTRRFFARLSALVPATRGLVLP